MWRMTVLGMWVWVSWLGSGSIAAWPPSPEEEEKVGQEAAREVEKEYRVVLDEAALARVERIGQEIARVSDRPAVTPQFVLLRSAEINALSIPGGRIYVTQGLLKFVRSDDELAGVLAHEIAHNSLYHTFRWLARREKTDWIDWAALLAAVLAREEGVAIMGQLMHLGLLNRYSEDLEREADSAGLRYLLQTKYNPVGLLTFMEHLAQTYGWFDEAELGVYRTHPPSRRRAAALIQQLQAHHVPLNRRTAMGMEVAWARPASLNGQSIGEVVLGEQLLFQAVATVANRSPLERAEEAASRINAALDGGRRVYLLQRTASGEVRITEPQGVLLTIVPGDAAVSGKSCEELGRALIAVLHREWLAQRIRGL